MLGVLSFLLIFFLPKCSIADVELFFYSDGTKQFVKVDISRLMIKWKPFEGSLEQSGYLKKYEELSLSEFLPVGDDGYFLHTLKEATDTDSLSSLLQSDTNVIAVNPVLFGEKSNPVWFGDQIVCRFEKNVLLEFIDSLFIANSIEIVQKSDYAPDEYLIRVTDASPLGTLDMANYLWEQPSTQWAHPNFEGGCAISGVFGSRFTVSCAAMGNEENCRIQKHHKLWCLGDYARLIKCEDCCT